jgi:hypothetical protein
MMVGHTTGQTSEEECPYAEEQDIESLLAQTTALTHAINLKFIGWTIEKQLKSEIVNRAPTQCLQQRDGGHSY